MASRLKPSIDIDLSALAANFRALAAATPGAAPAGVVKCDAYGLGLAPVARTLALKENCAHFFVAYAETGATLRAALADAAPKAEIFIFNGPGEEALAEYHASRLTPVINTLEQAVLWASAFPGAPAALHVDTGMNRLGLIPADIDALLAIKGLNIDLIMSHFACASTPGAAMLAQQHAAFDEIARHFPGARKSLASTGGALISKDYGYDLTRLGVGLYGVGPFGDPHTDIGPVATLSAPVIQRRTVKAGDSVGYDATRRFDAPAQLATLALGYGDGFPRAGSNKAQVFLGGALCPVVGIVSMDLIVVDVTAAPAPVAVGDRAELFGPSLPIETAARACGTIGYELLTSLGARIDRRYLFEGAPADPAMLAPPTRGENE